MPGIDYFAAASTATVIKAPADITADTTGAGVDISSYLGQIMLVTALINVTGTNPTMATKFQTSTDADYVGAIAYSGTGTGTITDLDSGANTVAEDITITFSNATTAAVVGGTTGAIGTATVGTRFTSPQISFMLTAGGTAFVNSDAFTVTMTEQVYTDISGATIASPGAVSTIARTVINAEKCGRFIRPVFDIGGTNSPKYTIGVTAYGIKNA